MATLMCVRCDTGAPRCLSVLTAEKRDFPWNKRDTGGSPTGESEPCIGLIARSGGRTTKPGTGFQPSRHKDKRLVGRMKRLS